MISSIESKALSDDRILFRIAGHLVEVVIPGGRDWRRLLPSFGSFKYWGRQEDEKPMFTLKTVKQLNYINLSSSRLLFESSEMIGSCFRLFETQHNYIVDIQFVKSGAWHRMLCDKSFRQVEACINWNDANVGRVLNAFIMFAFAQSAVLQRTLLIHASAVEKDGKGYAFLGRSGTGKSTHSLLWIKNIYNK